jgi:hypothetical protein
MPRKSLARIAADYYLKSPDFNGIRIDDLVDIDNGPAREKPKQAIREGKLENRICELGL